MTAFFATVTRAKDGRGGFFAVDRRAWHAMSLVRFIKLETLPMPARP